MGVVGCPVGGGVRGGLRGGGKLVISKMNISFVLMIRMAEKWAFMQEGTRKDSHNAHTYKHTHKYTHRHAHLRVHAKKHTAVQMLPKTYAFKLMCTDRHTLTFIPMGTLKNILTHTHKYT